MIEAGVVPVLQEIVLHGVLEIDPTEIVAIAVLFAALLPLLRFGVIRKDECETDARDGILADTRRTVAPRHRQPLEEPVNEGHPDSAPYRAERSPMA